MENLLNPGITIGSFTIYYYAIIIVCGILVATCLSALLMKRRNMSPDFIFTLFIFCIPSALICARLYYCITDGMNISQWFAWDSLRRGGLSIIGGVIGGVGMGVVVCLVKKVNFFRAADCVVVTILIAQAIGRWGNFANQEAYGRLVTDPDLQWFPYAVYIDAKGAYYQATFFYESILNCIGFALLLWIYCGKRKSFDGFSLAVYCIWYGTVRVCIEGLRSDSLYLIPGVLRVSQLVSGILIVAGIGLILAHMYRARAAGKKPFIFVDKKLLNDDYFGYAQSILSHPNVYDKSKKEKGILAKMFARTEDTPEPTLEELNTPPDDAAPLPESDSETDAAAEMPNAATADATQEAEASATPEKEKEA